MQEVAFGDLSLHICPPKPYWATGYDAGVISILKQADLMR